MKSVNVLVASVLQITMHKRMLWQHFICLSKRNHSLIVLTDILPKLRPREYVAARHVGSNYYRHTECENLNKSQQEELV